MLRNGVQLAFLFLAVIGAGIKTGAKAGGKALKSIFTGAKNHIVYLGSRGGQAVYVGITKNISKRTYAHMKKIGLDSFAIIERNLTRRQARGIEQKIIENNPLFINKINSITNHLRRMRPWHKNAMKYGEEWLEKNKEMMKNYLFQ
jgi:hypothetical protein